MLPIYREKMFEEVYRFVAFKMWSEGMLNRVVLERQEQALKTLSSTGNVLVLEIEHQVEG